MDSGFVKAMHNNAMMIFLQYLQLNRRFYSVNSEIIERLLERLLPAAGAARQYFRSIVKIKNDILHGIYGFVHQFLSKPYFFSLKPFIIHCFVLKSTIFGDFWT